MDIGNKIIIIGCPGSGKSYLSKVLSNKLNIDVYHLDMIHWKENWDHISIPEMKEEISKIVKKDKWIIDGNYSSSFDIRFNYADTVIFLDLSTEDCLESVRKRNGTKRDDFPSFLNETMDDEFINFITNFKYDERDYILSLINKYKDKKYLIFKNRNEVNSFIDSL